MQTRRERLGHEAGSVAVMAALLLPLLLLMAGLATGSVVVTAGERETQRAATQAAAAGAVSVSLLAIDDLAGISLGGGHVAVACDVAEANLSDAPLVDGFSTSAGSCTGEDTFTAAAAVAVDADLGSILEDLVGTAPAPAQRLFEVEPTADTSVDALLSTLAPALLGPEITVAVDAVVDPPLGGLLDAEGDVATTTIATARRGLKNLVVVPTDALTCEGDGFDGVLTGLIEDLLDGLLGLGGEPRDLLESCAVDDSVPATAPLVALLDRTSSPLTDELGAEPGLDDVACLLDGARIAVDDAVGGGSPTVGEMIAAVGDDEPVLLVLANASETAPVLEVLPVDGADLHDRLEDGDLDDLEASTDLGGMFRATIVGESPFGRAGPLC